MTSVIDFLQFKSEIVTPTLVLVGLHQNPDGSAIDLQAYSRALSNCRMILDRAKACDIPVAHVRSIAPKNERDRLRYPHWISGFEPMRNDMVFDVLQPSCYSNTEFSRAMEYSEGNFAIAGLFGETACLSTAVDAHHRHHKFIYLSDASGCRSNGPVPARMFHQAVSQVVSMYGAVQESADWSQSLMLKRRGR
ncbi:MAG: isochorismatase family protein [Pseudomonadota bacterium]